MPSQSQTQAFEPTPAMAHNDFSSFSGIFRHASMDHRSDANSKEVRFREPFTNSSIHGRHSIATSHMPLLAPVSSSSHLPKQSFQITNPAAGVDITAYFEQCRSVNEQLRKAHEADRKTWDIERAALTTRIQDLELRMNKAGAGSRRKSNDFLHVGARSFRPDFPISSIALQNGLRHQSISNAPVDHLKQENGKPVWEPDSPAPVTRVFSHDEDVKHLPSISEDEPDLSPQIPHENKPIPIQQIDQSLDGILVKSEGVKSSFTRIMSPIMVASPARSPSPKQQIDAPTFRLDASNLLDPLDAKLRKHAGHTPLLFDGQLSDTNTTGAETTAQATPREEKPLAPVPTARPVLRPSENSESYFSLDNIHAAIPEGAAEDELSEPEPQFEPVDDRSLTGPLMLDPSGKSQASHIFLDQLDSKLEQEVMRSLSNSPAHSPAISQQSTKTDDSEMPKLRLKKSTNFGSAYGTIVPGVCGR